MGDSATAIDKETKDKINVEEVKVSAETKSNANKMLAFVSLKEFVNGNLTLRYGGYQISQAKLINIILVGRSQSGKSTLLETFIQPQQAVRGRGFSVTKEPKLHTFVITNQELNKSFSVNIIDTPGLSEKRIDEDMKSRGDEEIIRLARQFLSNELTYLNVVIYVAVGGKCHERDTEAYEKVRQFLGTEFSENSMLVLSHCESLPKERIEQIIEDMKKFPETKEIIDYCKLGVFPYGTLSGDELAAIDEEEDSTSQEKLEAKIKKVKRTLTKIETMRKNILDVIFKMADKPRPITQLEGVTKHINQQREQIISEALTKERTTWNAELETEIKKYEERLKEIQKNEYEIFLAELKKQTQIQQEEYDKKIKLQAEEDRANFEKRLEEQQNQDRRELEIKITSLKDAEKREEIRLFEQEQERRRREQERIYREKMERNRKEQERLYREQQEELREQREAKWRAEQEALFQKRRADEERNLRAEAESKKSNCLLM